MTDLVEHLDLQSEDIAAAKRRELLPLFPEAAGDGGKVDVEQLLRALGEHVETGRERYGLNWPGKADCFKVIQAPSTGTLLPHPEESVNFDTTENVIIEGDNLEVLKLLQKSYLGKVKMIYIDPPYNTGNDFIYPDNYTESLQTYLQYTGQVDAEGRKFGTNSDTEGRFHSRWLNMMYPRLYLARNLLHEDGVIFISINDAELATLRLLMNDVFGEEQFIGVLVWKSRHNVDSRNQTGLSSDHEYVVCYGKRLVGRQVDLSKYSNPDGDPRGPWMSDNMVGLATREQRPNLHYDLENPATGVVYPCPEKGWRYDRSTMAQKIKENRILWPAVPEGRPRHKKFVRELRSQFTGFSSLLNVPNTAQGTQEVRELFGEAIFDFPKPVGLLEVLVGQVTEVDSDDVVLDFFAGSGTTAHAVLALNRQDGGNRKFILVQLPEPIDRTDYPTIADITKERVRRVIAKYAAEDAGKLDLDNASPQDRGFRVFTLGESNFHPWRADVPHNPDQLAKQLKLHVMHIRKGRTGQDILYELLLKSGYPLTTPIAAETIAGKTVYSLAGGTFLICLERELTRELIRAMADRLPERIVCLDEGFAGNDQLKANAVQIFRTKGVTSFKTV